MDENPKKGVEFMEERAENNWLTVERNMHHVDIPIPMSKDGKDKLYLLWIFEGGILDLELRVDGREEPLFVGQLSHEHPEMSFELDLTLPSVLPHVNVNNGRLILGFPEGSNTPESLTFKGDLLLSRRIAFNDLTYTCNW